MKRKATAVCGLAAILAVMSSASRMMMGTRFGTATEIAPGGCARIEVRRYGYGSDRR